MTPRTPIARRPVPQVVAHRGASGLVPTENSLEAFEKAIAVGAPWAELDVRRTADGVLVCHHDPEIDRVPISAMPWAAISERKPEVPRLADVVEAVGGRIALDVEIKEPGYEADVLHVLTALPLDGYVVKSFYDVAVLACKQADERVRAGLLLGIDKGSAGPLPGRIGVRMKELFPTTRLRACGADFASPNYLLVRWGFVTRCHRAGWEVWVWTVDDPKEMRRLARLGVDAVITNRPDVALDTYAQTALAVAR